MNVLFNILQGTGDAKEVAIDIYPLAHGASAAHKVKDKIAVALRLPAADDTESARSITENIVLLTKQEARAVASAMMGAAAEL